MSRVFLVGVVGAFRKCPVCERWYRTGNFAHRGTRCSQCYKDRATVRRGHRGSMTRAIALTDKGRAFLAAERAAA